MRKVYIDGMSIEDIRNNMNVERYLLNDKAIIEIIPYPNDGIVKGMFIHIPQQTEGAKSILQIKTKNGYEDVFVVESVEKIFNMAQQYK